MKETINSIELPLLAEIFDNFSEAVIVADKKRRFVYVNLATVNLFGFSTDQLYGEQTKMLYADEQDFIEQGQKRFNANSKKDLAESYRVAYLRADGQRFLGLTSGAAMRSDKGEVIGYIGIVRSARTSDQSLDTLHKVHAITSDVALNHHQKITALLQVGLKHFKLEIAIQSKINGQNYVVENCFDTNQQLQAGTNFDLSETYCVHTLQANHSVGFHYAGKSEIRNHPCYQNLKLESYIGSPIKVAGKVYGTINFSSQAVSDPFSKDDFILVELLADTLSYIIYTQQAENEIKVLAQTDYLTGLPNRRATMERLIDHIDSANSSGQLLTVLSIDIDHFKSINDQYGHGAGDEALIAFSHTASELGSQSDILGRVGGEEFLYILPGVDSDAGLNFGNKLRDRLSATPIKLGNHKSITLEASIGVATLLADESLSTLLARADAALYEAKTNGRNQVKLS